MPLHINTDSLGIGFYDLKNMASPLPSPSTSTSSADSLQKQPISRNKCQLNRPQQAQSPTKVTPKSWETMQSPAASFLAGFAFSPVQSKSIEEEQEGDEIDDYVIDRIIGYGGFSTVRQGFRISDGHHVAIKIVKKQDTIDMRLESELSIWKQLDHDHIVHLQKVLETDNATFLICDYCPGGNLLKLLEKKQSLSETEARRLFVQLAQALHYLHDDMKICHKDLKLENVLLDDNDLVKLCDFGLAICQQPLKINPATQLPLSPDLNRTEEESAGGSLAYAAPEQIKSRTAIGCPSTDIWSLGIILYALVTGRLPFSDDYDLRLQQKILAGQYQMPDHISSELKLLLQNCLNPDPQQRYTIQQVLESNWCQL
ncbi:Maternal embryonic leucine zipper kinase [Choanephora cucurbitarum]|uniref:Maternal embryonic leucine zipper kinase n=1 Tax=Choanephora cucurbitarum TaxID=101091 RepID=A0A1C7NG55_9FUNG|nr:Maternal embryonic leucine zipper kinase [Choanephora cucurbitarum]